MNALTASQKGGAYFAAPMTSSVRRSFMLAYLTSLISVLSGLIFSGTPPVNTSWNSLDGPSITENFVTRCSLVLIPISSCARSSARLPPLVETVSRPSAFQDLKAGILDSSHIQKLQRFQHRPSHSEYKPRWNPHSRHQYYRRLLRQNNNSSHHPD